MIESKEYSYKNNGEVINEETFEVSPKENQKVNYVKNPLKFKNKAPGNPNNDTNNEVYWVFNLKDSEDQKDDDTRSKPTSSAKITKRKIMKAPTISEQNQTSNLDPKYQIYLTKEELQSVPNPE